MRRHAFIFPACARFYPAASLLRENDVFERAITRHETLVTGSNRPAGAFLAPERPATPFLDNTQVEISANFARGIGHHGPPLAAGYERDGRGQIALLTMQNAGS